MALLEQHSPSSPAFHNLHQFTDAISPTAPTTGFAASIRHPRGNSRCQSELHHNCTPLISIPSTLTCLPHIHPLTIPGSPYSIHSPPKPWPPSSTFPINFCAHYFFQQSFVIHPLQMTEPSQNIRIYSSYQFSPHTCSRSHYYHYYYYYYYYIPDCKPQLGEIDAKNPKAPAGKTAQ